MSTVTNEQQSMKTRKLVTGAMLAALTTVATLLSIPALGGSGYVNFGDGLVILSGVLLGGPYGILAAAIGSMLADVILGYFAYAPATFIIKGLMSLAVWLVYSGLYKKKPKWYILWLVLVAVMAECIMTFGYFLYEIPLYGIETATLGMPGNLLQSSFGIITSVVLGSILMKMNVQRFWER